MTMGSIGGGDSIATAQLAYEIRRGSTPESILLALGLRMDRAPTWHDARVALRRSWMRMIGRQHYRQHALRDGVRRT